MEKRIYDQTKTMILATYNPELGRLTADRIFVAHHAATAEVQEKSHLEVLKEYLNGGKDVKTVIDTPYQPAREAYDEFEDIFVFVPFTAEELAENRAQKYKSAIVGKIRSRYTLDDELALARQRETKTAEWAAYNAFCEQCKTEVKNELGA